MGCYISDSHQETFDEKNVFHIFHRGPPVISNKTKTITIPCFSSNILYFITITHKTYPLIKYDISSDSIAWGFKVCSNDIIEIKCRSGIIQIKDDLFLIVNIFMIGKRNEGLDYDLIRKEKLDEFIPNFEIYHNLLQFDV